MTATKGQRQVLQQKAAQLRIALGMYRALEVGIGHPLRQGLEESPVLLENSDIAGANMLGEGGR